MITWNEQNLQQKANGNGWEETKAPVSLSGEQIRSTLPEGAVYSDFRGEDVANWTGNDLAILSFGEEGMHLECKSFVYPNEAVVCKHVEPSEDFIWEVRAKMGYFGNDNGMFLSFNGVRAVIYLFESKVRLNLDRLGKEYPKGELIYTEIGYDWHTYRVEMHDRVGKFYLDGVYLASFEAEQTGMASGEMGFHAFPINQYNSTHMDVDYAWYLPLGSRDLTVTSPASRQTVEADGEVIASCALSDELAASGEPVSFYLNGILAGKAEGKGAAISLGTLPAGMYSLACQCKAQRSGVRIFEVLEKKDEEETAIAAPTPSSRILSYRVGKSGKLVAGDGRFALELTYQEGNLTYRSDEGIETASVTSGDAIAVVDGGIADVYQNGKLIVSYRMPFGACGIDIATEGEITDLSVRAHNETLFETEEKELAIDQAASFLPYNYAVEFVYKKGEAFTISAKDGAYHLHLTFEANGDAKAIVAPHMHAFTQTLGQVADGVQTYRVAIFDGIAQLFVNNIWKFSWRMPATVAKRALRVSGRVEDGLRVRTVRDLYFYRGTPKDADWSSYIGEHCDLPDTHVQCLKVFPHNLTVSAEVAVGRGAKGLFALVGRYFDGTTQLPDAGIYGGYDFDRDCFVIGSSLARLEPTGSPMRLGEGDVFTLTLTVEEEDATLRCNGLVVGRIHNPQLNGDLSEWGVVGKGKLTEWKVNGCGNVGYVDLYENLTLRSLSYEGDSLPLCGTATTMIPHNHTVAIFETAEAVYIAGEWGQYYRSDDGGDHFVTAEYDREHISFNYIRLQSGKLLSLVRKQDEQGFTYFAYLSEDEGKTFGEGYDVMGDRNSYRITMNGKLMQASNGRVLFVSGETEDENIGMLWIYYSDDEGKTWKRAETIFNHAGTGMNLQEGAIVEMDGGVLRMYARNDGGFLVYSESHDNGVTWDLNMQVSNFISVVSAFNVTRDPDNGDIYMAWEYNNVNDCAIIQFPRTRVGVARSCDGGATWEYVGDFDDRNQIHFRTFGHWNIGIWVTKDSVFATTGKQVWTMWYNCTVRIRKSTIRPLARFTGVRCPLRDPAANSEGVRLLANDVLAISADGSRLYAAGNSYALERADGLSTLLPIEAVAAFLHGSLTKGESESLIRVGATDYIFRANSQTAALAGEEAILNAAPVWKQGTLWLSLGEVCRLFALQAWRAEDGRILLTRNGDNLSIDPILSLIGM